ncbi:diguanylate cyclase domain-containing protein [Aquabacterium sp. OR-4]|uniref:diguanylate cyclase domain-containing protein n=1 Tax=Aquabacterium sp. OR-4 TaxID=2978127 RepID=UPI0021B4699F|nr:GGDEF domain-containing protein [Aquabacterium sp. OR-4]MDT7836178.1 GGDEF domain-containing protein [Aquabacterium sp. OR-4]
MTTPSNAAAWAKGALRRLATAQLEPTPANYARAYAEESGEAQPGDAALPPRARAMIERLAMRLTDEPALRGELAGALMAGRWDDAQKSLERCAGAAGAQGEAWARLIERLAKGLERGGRQWTAARKKDSLARVLEGSRSDAARLQQRLGQLVGTWEIDTPDAAVGAADTPIEPSAAMPPAVPAAPPKGPALAAPRAGAADVTAAEANAPDAAATQQLVHELTGTVRAGLPGNEPRAGELADELAALAARVQREGATPALAEAVAGVCQRVRGLFGLREELVDELLALTRALSEGLAGPAAPTDEGDWLQGQGQALRARLDAGAGPEGGTSARAVRAARDLLARTREQQRTLAAERVLARDALRQVVQQVMAELGELGQATGRFGDQMAAYATRIAAAESLEHLASLVQEMVGESRAVHSVVAGARDRLAAEHARAGALEARVRALELELRRLDEEVSTDALTQVANRRGLERAFEAEAQRRRALPATGAPAQAPLAVGLIDIDNFKKLNDSLGHAAGDEALKALAERVRGWLRPGDHVARFGGEEFVVLLPDTPLDEAQQALTRLQRQLTASLFMHNGQEVFVTFSAGVSAWRDGEPLQRALERADEGLYEAKRTGKNRTCVV